MSRRVADLLIKIGADSYEFQQKTRQVEKRLDGLSKRLTSIGKTMSVSLTAPIAALGGMAVMAADGAIKAAAKVQQAIKATGGAAKLTFEQLNAEADKLEGLTLFDGDDILNGATAQLLTFTNIAGDSFKRTQAVALDLATVLQGDLKSASIQLGKALNDPVKNLSALSRSGIQFSKEQTAVIKSLAETGRLAETQALILDELERQYGGQAEAAAKVGAYSLNELKDAWGRLMDDFGMIVLPLLNKVVGVLKDVVKWIQTLSPATKITIAVVAGLAASIGPVLITLGGIVKILPLLKAGMLALNSPMTALIALAAMLAAGLYSAFNSYKQLQNANNDTAIQWVADGTCKVGDEERIKGYIEEYKKAKQKNEEYYSEKLGDFWKGMNADYRKGRDNAQMMIDVYQRVLVELEKRKKLEEESAAASTKAMEAAKKQAEELARSIAVITTPTATTRDAAPSSLPEGFSLPAAQVTFDTPDPVPIVSQIRPAVDYIGQQYRAIWSKVYEMFGWMDSTSEKFDKLTDKTFDVIENHTDRLVKKGWNFSDALSHVSEVMASTISSMNSTMQNALGDLVSSSAEMLGQIIGGADLGLNDFLNLILSQMANFLKQLGSQLIEFGMMILMFKSALSSLLANPWLAIGVGAAMVATAGVLTAVVNRNAEKNVPKLAKGGLAFGSTYAMVGDNPNARIDPEVIAPLSKLKQMFGESGSGSRNMHITLGGKLTASGRDLAYILSKENFKVLLLGG